MLKTNFLGALFSVSQRRLRQLFWLLLYLTFSLLLSRLASAAQVTLEWDANPDPDIAGYKVYYGNSSGNYQGAIDVANNTTYTLLNLQNGATYYFAATDYYTSGFESEFSNEVSYAVPGIEYGHIDLSPGWNLISLPVQPFDTSLEAVLKSISGKFYFVEAFSSEGVFYYFPGYPEWNTLETMEAGWGYFINMMDSETLEVAGLLPPKSIDLFQGWNLVGYNSLTALPVSVALGTIADKVISVWAYENEGYKVYYPSDPGQTTLFQLDPGKGYYIFMNQDTKWELP